MPLPDRRTPVVDLARIDTIPTLEVMETDMEQLDTIVTQETTALGFFTGAAGAFLSAALGWLASSGLSPVRHALFGVVTLTMLVFSAWFYAQWRLVKARRPALLRSMRDRTTRAAIAAN